MEELQFMNKKLISKLSVLFACTFMLIGCGQNTPSSSSIFSRSEDNYFKATFVNYDDSFLYSQYFREGTIPSYGGNLPTREDADGCHYVFSNWDHPFEPIHMDEKYKAVYTSTTINTYRIRFFNYDNTLLYETSVFDGDIPVYKGPVPTREDSADGNSYTFAGWNKSVVKATCDTDYIATFTSKKKQVTVKFLNYDDSLLDIETVTFGDSVTYHGTDPVRPTSLGIKYTFNGWDKSLFNIREDTEIRAVYSSEAIYYTVKFVNYDEEVLYTTQVTYGESAYYGLGTPSKPFNRNHQFIFAGWDQDTSYITGDLTVHATYTECDRYASDCLTYEYDINTDSYFVQGFYGYYDYESQRDLYIPATYDGQYGVKKVTRILSYAFSNMGIRTVYLGDNVTIVESYAFAWCYQLTNVWCGDNTVEFGNECFNNCYNLVELEFGASLAKVGNNFAIYTNSLKTISISKRNKAFVFENGFLMNSNKTILYLVLSQYFSEGTSLVIPEGIMEIAYYACYNNGNIEKLTIPSSVEKIGSSAFSSCYNLRTLVLNDCPCSIGDNAFSNCSNLSSVSLGKSVVFIDSYVFSWCSSLKSIIIPASLISISSYAFINSSLESITVDSENPNYISENGFLYDINKTNLLFIPRNYDGEFVVPSSLSYFDISTLIQDTNISSFSVESGNMTYSAKDGILYSNDKTILYACPKSKTSVDIASIKIKTISSYAFRQSSLTEIEFPQTLVAIEYSAFSESNITSVTLPSALTRLDNSAFTNCNVLETVDLSKTKITYLGSYSFAYSYSLKSISLPETLQTIDYYAFISSGIENIDLSTTKVSTIDFDAFRDCQMLESVIFPSTLTSLSTYTFNNCTSLKTVDFSLTKLETIGQYAFYKCANLVEVIGSPYLNYLGDSAFAFCHSLKRVYINSSLSYFGEYVFSDDAIDLMYFEKGNYFDEAAGWHYGATIKQIFYHGSVDDYSYSLVGRSQEFYYYSETKAEGCWHYDKDGNMEIWEND